MYCLNLFWTATGDVTTAPTDKVRNDAMDMTYVVLRRHKDIVPQR